MGMDYSLRNEKVAVARWRKTLETEISKIPNNKESMLLRAILCGFLAGDGSVIRRTKGNAFRYDIGFYPDDISMLNCYLSTVKQLYGKQPRTTKRSGVFQVRITSKTIYEDLRRYANFGIYSWSLPKKLFLVDGALELWLRAFFSAEGYVGHNQIKLQTVNKLGMLEVSKVLNRLHIKHGFYKYSPKNKSYSQVSIISITSPESRKMFIEKIGFWHNKKNKILRDKVYCAEVA